MSYRIEVTKDNRKAACQDTVCKKKANKILKGESRLGTWVEMPAFNTASWKWRHWGCISGQILENIRNILDKGDGETDYQWEYMDGLDECPPDVQEKFKTAIIDGKIADEDFNGDPEFNVLGQKGIRSRASLKAATGMPESPQKNEVKSETPSADKKRGRPVKEENGDGEADIKPVQKRAKRVKKEEYDDEEVLPVKAQGKKAVKKEEDIEEEVKPTRKPRAKKVVKKEESEEPTAVPSTNDENETPAKEEATLEDVKPAKKSRAKKAVKAEQTDQNVETAEHVRVTHGDSKDGVKPSKKAKSKKETSAEVDLHDIPLKDDEGDENEVTTDAKGESEETKKPKKGKTKKAATPATRPKSTRRQAAKTDHY